MSQSISLRYPRFYALIWSIIGLVIVLLAIDMQFFKVLPWTHDSVVPVLIVFVVGAVFLLPSVKNLLFPSNIFHADQNGITVFSGTSHDEWDETAGKFKNVQRAGEPRFVPWADVISIGESEVTWVNDRRLRSPDGQAGNRSNQVTTWTAPAVRILCEPSIKVDGFTLDGFVQSRTAYEPGDITSEDREHFSEAALEDLLKTEILISHKAFRGSPQSFAERLTALRRNSTANDATTIS